MKFLRGGVTAAEGFTASGMSAGIKRNQKPDLALVYAHKLVTAAAVFTTNRIKAAPVQISQQRVRKGVAQAVLINSGCANCLTGKKGFSDANYLSRVASKALEIRDEDMLIASTGLIGRKLPVSRIVRALPSLIRKKSRSQHRSAARAILTTDKVPKEVAVEQRINGKVCKVGGMAKGAGMIAPSMATMLCVITTDVSIDKGLLQKLLRETITVTFNRISVDGDMSTNDTVFVLASGDSGVNIQRGTKPQRQFAHMLQTVSAHLAAMIVEDGEGVKKTMEIEVTSARTNQQAQACARQVACSPLVKTMLAGSDPNVGRIAGAVGASSAYFDPDKLKVYINGHLLVARGTALDDNRGLTRQLLNQPKVHIRIDLAAGKGYGMMFTSDLTESYVRINAGYAT